MRCCHPVILQHWYAICTREKWKERIQDAICFASFWQYITKSSGQKKPQKNQKNNPPTKNPQPKPPPLSAWSMLTFFRSLLCFYTAIWHWGTKQHSILNTKNQASLALSNVLDAKEICSCSSSPANSVTILLTWHFWSPKYNSIGKGEKKNPTLHHPKSTFHFAAYLLLNRPQRIPSFENRKINTHTPLMHSG